MSVVNLLPLHYREKINLNYKKITIIGVLPNLSPFMNVKCLHLSFNRIEKLNGLEQFPHLISLSLNNNLIQNMQEFNVVTKQLEFLNMQFNPFIKLNYGYYEYFITTFERVKRLNGDELDHQLNNSLIDKCEVLCRWYIYFNYLVAQQYKLAVQIVEKRQIATQIKGVVIQPFLLIKQLNHALIENCYTIQLSVDKEFSQRGLLKTILKLNNIFVQFIPDCQLLDKSESRAFKQVYYESFSQLISHQSSKNNFSFIDYLIQCGGKDSFETFQRIVESQSHVQEDFFELSDKASVSHLDKRQLIIPAQVNITTGLKLNLIQHQQTDKKPLPLKQYFPVFAFRLDYMQSLMFVLNDRIISLLNVLDDLSYTALKNANFEDPNENKIHLEKSQSQQQIQQQQKQQKRQQNQEVKQKLLIEQLQQKKQLNQQQQQEQLQVQKQSLTLNEPKLVRQQQIDNQLIRKEPGVQAKRILNKTYVQVLIKCLTRVNTNVMKASFKLIKKFKTETMSQVQRIFTLKKVFDIMKNRSQIQRVKNYYNHQLLTLAYICLFNHSDRAKKRRLALQKCQKVISKKRIEYLIHSFIVLKDVNNNYSTIRRLGRMNSKYSIKSKSKQEIRETFDTKRNKEEFRQTYDTKRNTVCSPQRDLDETLKKIEVPKIVYFFDKMNKKTCSVCHYDLGV